jgi:signal transduction histidine kinase
MALSSEHPLATLRLRLTIWYAATFCAILALLGTGLFLTVRHQLADQLDQSLRDATSELRRAALIREMEASNARGKVVDAVDELHIPDRELFLFDSAGRPVKPPRAEGWLTGAAQTAMRRGEVDVARDLPHDKRLRVHAERFALASGTPFVAMAVADNVELEDRYASLIAAFGGAAIVALLLVAVGGSLLVRKSTAPVELSIAHMRRFMADAAHELRTPLTVLRSRAEIALQQRREPSAYVAALEGIESEARRLGHIVEDLLTLARADAGERPIERQRVFLDDIALDAAEAARAVAQQKGVELTMREFEEATVDGDAGLLRQLVMTLLDNAIKFTPRGGRVEVRVNTLASGPILVVEDTGIGITAEQLPHVFERFYRGDPSRQRTMSGAGLGLSIARWIADAHGASIDITSTPGHGTRAQVQFMSPTSPAHAVPETREHVEPEASSPARL